MDFSHWFTFWHGVGPITKEEFEVTLPTTLLPFLWHFVKKQRFAFLWIQLLAFAWSIDNTAWPYAFKLLIDEIADYQGDKALIWSTIAPTLMFWLGLWITIETMYRGEGFLMAKAFPKLEANIRMSMFKYIEGHSYEFFANNFSGNISNRISDMVHSATNILLLVTTLFAPAALCLIIACSVFFTIHPVFTAILSVWALVYLIICVKGAKYCTDASNLHAFSRSYLNGKIVDTLGNIINVKLFAKQKQEYDYLHSFQAQEQLAHSAALTTVEKIKLALNLSSFIFPGILLTWFQIVCWQKGLTTVGDLVLIFNTTWNVMLITWYAGLELPNLFREIGVCQQALSLIQAKHDIVDTPGATPLVIKTGEIKFENVCFNYAKDKEIFKNLNLTLPGGSKIGLVGYSGSGKSTFVNLILRFFEPTSGRITIDGQDITQITSNSLREAIAMIPQSPSLFHRSLIENIRYGNELATMEDIVRVSKEAHCHEFIESLPQGYDTLVGERGMKLSGGQRQRIAIARALLKQSSIIIFDEATSALDSLTEHHIQEALKTLEAGRTTLIIAHRLSTLSEVDFILVFDKGCIVEQGTHASLLAQGGHYAKLWELQAGGFLPDVTPESTSDDDDA